MLSSVSFGQYYPQNSLLHKADARVKMIVVILCLIFIFIASSFWSVCLITAFVIATVAVSKVPVKLFMRNLKPIIPILIIASLLNVFYVDTGKKLISYGIITITDDGLIRAGYILLRIILLIVIGGLLTYTTTPTELTMAIERLLSPLKYIGLGEAVHTLAMMMTIALRFIPTLLEETDKIIQAQKSRGADFENGKLIKRIKSLIPILVPLLISSVRRALELADAMECRYYTGGKGRTHLKQFKMKISDYLILFLTIGVCAGVVLLNGVL